MIYLCFICDLFVFFCDLFVTWFCDVSVFRVWCVFSFFVMLWVCVWSIALPQQIAWPKRGGVARGEGGGGRWGGCAMGLGRQSPARNRAGEGPGHFFTLFSHFFHTFFTLFSHFYQPLRPHQHKPSQAHTGERARSASQKCEKSVPAP